MEIEIEVVAQTRITAYITGMCLAIHFATSSFLPFHQTLTFFFFVTNVCLTQF